VPVIMVLLAASGATLGTTGLRASQVQYQLRTSLHSPNLPWRYSDNLTPRPR
jgi:hypothetical protein